MLKLNEFQNVIRRDFGLLGCAQLHDAAMQYTHYVPVPLVTRTALKKVSGPVFPVITENDMLPCLQALDAAPKGAVLYVHNRAESSEALAGDIFVTAAREQGLAGLIVNGAVRDLDVIEHMDFPVFSKEVTFVSAKTAKVAATAIPSVISFDQFEMEPFDWIFADSDGVLVVKAKYIKTVHKAAMLLRSQEEALRARLCEGNRLSDLCGLHDYIAGRASLKFEA